MAAQDQASSATSTGKEAAAQSAQAEDPVGNASKDVKVVANGGSKKAAGDPGSSDDVNAILITGATHARELLSSQVPLFMCLKLLH